MHKTIICKFCKKELNWVGFERKLITRGKNKGTYIYKDFYKNCDCRNKG